MRKILDPCCGSRMFYFDKENKEVLYADCRAEEHTLCDGRKLVVAPDAIHDFRDMPYDDESFNLVVFDPPHLHSSGEKSFMRLKYGRLSKDRWMVDINKGVNECWRVLADKGTLIFKWNETQIKIKDILDCIDQKPLFGHTTMQNLKTHWMVFFKNTGQANDD